jgi:hypothetical protein
MIEALSILTTAILGLFAGSLLTEALLLVPFFRSLSFADFNRLHEEFGPRLYRYYAPLTISATVLPVGLAGAAFFVGARGWVLACVPAVLALMILATYLLYFEKANRAFAEKKLDEPGLAKELARWASVHNFRTLLAVSGFVVSVFVTMQTAGGILHLN